MATTNSRSDFVGREVLTFRVPLERGEGARNPFADTCGLGAQCCGFDRGVMEDRFFAPAQRPRVLDSA